MTASTAKHHWVRPLSLPQNSFSTLPNPKIMEPQVEKPVLPVSAANEKDERRGVDVSSEGCPWASVFEVNVLELSPAGPITTARCAWRKSLRHLFGVCPSFPRIAQLQQQVSKAESFAQDRREPRFGAIRDRKRPLVGSNGEAAGWFRTNKIVDFLTKVHYKYIGVNQGLPVLTHSHTHILYLILYPDCPAKLVVIWLIGGPGGRKRKGPSRAGDPEDELQGGMNMNACKHDVAEDVCIMLHHFGAHVGLEQDLERTKDELQTELRRLQTSAQVQPSLMRVVRFCNCWQTDKQQRHNKQAVTFA